MKKRKCKHKLLTVITSQGIRRSPKMQNVCVKCHQPIKREK